MAMGHAAANLGGSADGNGACLVELSHLQGWLLSWHCPSNVCLKALRGSVLPLQIRWPPPKRLMEGEDEEASTSLLESLLWDIRGGCERVSAVQWWTDCCGF